MKGRRNPLAGSLRSASRRMQVIPDKREREKHKRDERLIYSEDEDVIHVDSGDFMYD